MYGGFRPSTITVYPVFTKKCEFIVTRFEKNCNIFRSARHCIDESRTENVKGSDSMTIDPQVVAAARGGDDKAFETLYSLIYRDLYKAAYGMLGNPDDAQDAVSETVLDAYRGIFRLRDDTLFRAWIFKILYLRCKNKKAEYVAQKNMCDIEAFGETLTDERTGDPAETVAVRQALMKLNEKDRAVVILHSYLGYNGAQIAEILGWPHGTVNSRISRAHKKLREMLE